MAPGATALAFEGRAMSFGELDRRSDLLANFLRSRGVAPGVLVGHYVERGPDMVVGLLGILKAGGAYVPLDPAYPKPCLQYMLDDSGAELLLTQEALANDFSEQRAGRILVDADWGKIADCAPVRSRARATPADLAYVIYTSGSTGRPKGVEVPHGALVNFLESMQRRPGLTRRDVLLAITSLSFDIAGLELFLPLAVGARCEIVGREVAADGARLAACLAETGATVMQATPTTWLMLLEAGWQGDRDLTILCGGEAMSRELADRLLPRCKALWNMYGPTETTIWSTVERVEASDESVSIGSPIANTQVYVLGPDLESVAPGCEGELYIGGDGVARGYWNRPGMTAERFLPDPFSPRAGARLYRTGDLARQLPDGRFAYLGRVDHQVKIRGFRIELGAIDATLSRHPAVWRSVTVAREDEPGGKRLVSYVVLDRSRPGRDREPSATVAELRRLLAERLPAPMVPSAFVVLEAMPLTPNGKIDRAALPAPDRGTLRLEIDYVTPRDDLEATLAAAWESVFSVAPIGIDDDFFLLGGHSLLALRLVTAMERACGHRFPLAALIGAPSVRLLAERIRSAAPDAPRSSLVEVQGGGSRPPFFLLPGGTGIVDGFGILAARHLAELLGPDQPVFAFQADAPGPDRLEDLALSFVRDLRARFPDGPYDLGGYSYGALVAFEMARILRGQGQTVGLVALIDMWGLNFPAKLPRLKRWRQKTGSDLRVRLSRLTRQPLLELRSAVGLTVEAEGDPGLRQFERMMDDYRASLASRRYPGRLTLFRASEPLDMPGFCLDEPTNGCSSLAEDLEVYNLPGDHLTLLREPNVYALAEELRSCLREAQVDPSSRPLGTRRNARALVVA